jgi:hypothetical protein
MKDGQKERMACQEVTEANPGEKEAAVVSGRSKQASKQD